MADRDGDLWGGGGLVTVGEGGNERGMGGRRGGEKGK